MLVQSRIGRMVMLAAGLSLIPLAGAAGQTWFTEGFAYPDGGLGGNDGWSGLTAGAIDVVGGEVKITGGAAGVVISTLTLPVPILPCEDGTITVTMKAKGGAGTSLVMYGVWFNDANGKNFARWNAKGASARGRMGATTTWTSLDGDPLSTTSFDELKVVIDVLHDTSTYYLNGILLSGTPTLPHVAGAGDSLGQIQIERTANASVDTDFILLDDISINGCTGPCFATITPRMPKNVSAPAGGPATPGSLDFLVNNTSGSAIIVTAAEVDGAGAPTDYPWLSLSTGSVGPLSPGASAAVTAGFDASTLGVGWYEGFVKFADSCSPSQSYTRTIRLFVGTPVPCFMDAFTYPDGPLANRGAWAGGSAGQIEVNNSRVLLTAGEGAENATVTFSSPPAAGPDGKLIVSLDIMQDVPTGSSGSNFWGFWVNAANGGNFGRWYQASYNPRPRIDGTGLVLPAATLPGDGQFHKLQMIIDTISHMTEFFFDGTSLGLLDHSGQSTGNTIGSVYIERWNRIEALGAHIYFDNIIVKGDCDYTCSLGITPGAGVVSTAQAGTPAVPAAYTYALLNTNSTPAGYVIEEIDATPTPVDWLLLNKTTGPLLAPEAADLVTATLNGTELLPGGEYVKYLKITNTCSPAVVSYRPLKVMVLGDNCLLETFPYLDGALNGQPGWSGTAGAEIAISGGSGSMVGGPNTVSVVENVPAACPSCSALPAPVPAGGLQDRVIVTRMKIKGNPGGVGGNMFYLYFRDENGANLAWWYGGTTAIRGRAGGTTTPDGILTGGWDEIKAVIDVDALKTEYFFNGTSLGTLTPEGTGFTVASVTLQRQANAGLVNQVVLFDDLTVGKCRTKRDLLCAGHASFADADGDGDVDQVDFSVLQSCLTGQGVTPVPSVPAYCGCFDRGSDAVGGDNDIDSFDFEAFELCASGSGIPADPACGN